MRLLFTFLLLDKNIQLLSFLWCLKGFDSLFLIRIFLIRCILLDLVCWISIEGLNSCNRYFLDCEGRLFRGFCLIEFLLNRLACGYVLSRLIPLKEAVLHSEVTQAHHNTDISFTQIL